MTYTWLNQLYSLALAMWWIDHRKLLWKLLLELSWNWKFSHTSRPLWWLIISKWASSCAVEKGTWGTEPGNLSHPWYLFASFCFTICFAFIYTLGEFTLRNLVSPFYSPTLYNHWSIFTFNVFTLTVFIFNQWENLFQVLIPKILLS